MQIELKLFAIGRQRVGSDSVSIELPESARVSDLRRAIGEQIPALSGLASSLMISVDAEYARDDTVIPPNSEVAAIPPVSGGTFTTRQTPSP
ncbi:MAG TPA: MoaD/ThiS family protein [Isosphaeraceae bacterium]|nr:MoaD/ThiS family protein [Isosphaeraceae bacterium]